MSKTANNWKKSDKLEQELKEDEKELEAIKEALEKKNMNALHTLPIKNLPKTSRLSAKIPKRLSEKEKERREEIRRLKEVEDLDKIQKQLFKQVKSRRKIEPIDKKILITAKNSNNANNSNINIDKDDLFALNLNKDYERVFCNENSKQYIPNKTVTGTWRKKEKEKSLNRNSSQKKEDIGKIRNNSKHNGKNKIIKKKGYPLSAIDRLSKVNKNNEKTNGDQEKDEEFLKNLQNELKIFYMEKEKDIFILLKEINLCRFINCFLMEGYDLFEQFIELPEDFFDKMEKPFLDKEQQKKLYDKLSIFKKNRGEMGRDVNKKNNFYKTQPEFNKQILKQNLINKEENIKKNKNEINLKNNYNNGNNSINEKVSNGTSTMNDDKLYNGNIDIEELERQNAEDFKKAVDEWRNNDTNKKNDIKDNNILQNKVDKNSKINQESNAPVNDLSLLVNSPEEIICCWNCFKPIKKEKSFRKDYKNQLDNSILFTDKNFCSLKCIKDYEKKKKTTMACFECNKIFDLNEGFVAYEGEKFCSTKCKEKYIEIEKTIIKNNKKKKEKKIKEIKIEKKEDDYYEGDYYDPMDDF